MFEELPSLLGFQPQFYAGGPIRFYLPLFYDLVAGKRPKSIVTLGFGDGQAFFTFCQAAGERNIECQCLAVRREDNDETETADLAWLKGKGYGEKFYGDLARFQSGTDAVKEVAEGSVDLLLLDCYDSGAEIPADLSTWEPKLAPNGLVLVHGIGLERSDDLKAAWLAWTASRSTAEFPDGIGLGIALQSEARGFQKPLLEQQLFGGKKGPGELIELYRLAAARIEAQVRADEAVRAQIALEARQAWVDSLLADRRKVQEIMDHQTHTIDSQQRDFEILRRDRAKAQLVMDAQAEQLRQMTERAHQLDLKRAKLKAEVKEKKQILNAVRKACRKGGRCFQKPGAAEEKKYRPISERILREIKRAPGRLFGRRQPAAPRSAPKGRESATAGIESPAGRYAAWMSLNNAGASSDKPDLLFVSHDLSWSGAPLILLQIAKWCKKQGFFVAVMSPSQGPLREEFYEAGIPILVDPLITTGHPSFTALARQFDCVIASTIFGAPIVHTVKSAGIPHLWWIHEGRVAEQYLRTDPALREALGIADLIVTPDTLSSLVYQPFTDRPVRVLSYGIPDPRPAFESAIRRGPEPVKFLLLGTIEQRKGQQVFLEALRQLPADVLKNARFQIVGRPQDPVITSEIVAAARGSSYLTYGEGVAPEEALDLIRGTEVMVCSSWDETGPLILMEALALGKAILSTTVGAVAENLAAEEGGLFVAPGDSAALAAAIERFVREPDLIERLGRNSRKGYEKYFTFNRFAEGFVELLREAISSQGSKIAANQESAHN